jgi:hypothetical protein
MDKAIQTALDKLEAGKWGAAKALAAIEKGAKKAAAKRASWLSVRIVEEGKKKMSFTLPLGAVSLVLAAAQPLVKWGLRHAAKKDKKGRIPDLRNLNLRELLKVLKNYGPMKVVEVYDGDTEILIVTT